MLGWQKVPSTIYITRIGRAKEIRRVFHCSVVTQRELSNTAKLSDFKPICALIPIFGHEYELMTGRLLFHV